MQITLEKLTIIYQIILFQFIAIPFFRNVSYKLALNRNRTWVKSNPNILLEHPKPNGLSHIFIGMGLIAIYIVADKSNLEINLNFIITIASALLMIIQHLLIDHRIFLKLTKIIPKEVRQATLERRNISKYIKSPFTILATILCISLLIIDISFGFYRNAAIHFIAYLIMLIVFLVSVKRKPIHHNNEVDKQYRELEKISSFIIIITIALGHLFTFLTETNLIKEQDQIKSLDNALILTAFGVFMFIANKILNKLPKELP